WALLAEPVIARRLLLGREGGGAGGPWPAGRPARPPSAGGRTPSVPRGPASPSRADLLQRRPAPAARAAWSRPQIRVVDLRGGGDHRRDGRQELAGAKAPPPVEQTGKSCRAAPRSRIAGSGSLRRESSGLDRGQERVAGRPGNGPALQVSLLPR